MTVLCDFSACGSSASTAGEVSAAGGELLTEG